MSDYYNPKRTRNLYKPGKETSFRLSRSKIDLFLNCPRCFYLERRLGVAQPPGFPFSLNNAVDTLLKKEFDIHRVQKTQHPFMQAYGISAIPFNDVRMEEWRDAIKRGIKYVDPITQFLVTGGVDDVWINDKKELHIVDYKATSKDEGVSLDAPWQIGYKRQVEIYQWLFRKNGFLVSDTAYFVYCNGTTDKKAFDGKLEFDVRIIPYSGNSDWVEQTLVEAKKCLDTNELPHSSQDCDFCAYRNAAHEVEYGCVNGFVQNSEQPRTLFD